MHSRAHAFYIPATAEKKDLPTIIDKYQKGLAYFSFIISGVSGIFLFIGLNAQKSAPYSYFFICANLICFCLLGIYLLSSRKAYITTIMKQISKTKNNSEVRIDGLINTNLALLLQIYFFLYGFISILGLSKGL